MKTFVNRHIAVFLVSAALCGMITLFSCTPSLTDGNSSETTNVAIVTSTGQPAVGAKVKLIDAGNWAYLSVRQKNVVLDSAIAGPDGTATFSTLPGSTCNLQIDHVGSGIVVPGFSRNGKTVDSTGLIRLRNYATLRGTCSADSEKTTYAILDGTSYRSPVTSDGSFVFSGVAPAMYSLVLGNSFGNLSLAGTASLVEGKTFTGDTIRPQYTSLLIDDFEGGDSTSVLGRITNGYWYRFDDAHDGGHTTIATSIQQGAGPRGTSVMRADIVLGQDTGIDLYAGVGVYIGTNKREWDFSSMTAISFWARGKKTIRVSVESHLIDSIQSWPNFGKTIALDSVWRHIVIPVDSLDLRNSKAADLGITWATAAKRIYRIEFDATEAYDKAGDTIKLELDDIRIEGISPSELFLQVGDANGIPE